MKIIQDIKQALTQIGYDMAILRAALLDRSSVETIIQEYLAEYHPNIESKAGFTSSVGFVETSNVLPFKLTKLRERLLTSGYLGIQPEDLKIQIQNGQVINHYAPGGSGANDNFKLEYEAVVFVLDYASNLENLTYTINLWHREHSKNHDSDSITFEMDLLDNYTKDLQFTIKGIADSVKISHQDDGIHLTICDCGDVDPIILPAGEWQLDIKDIPADHLVELTNEEATS